MSKIESNRGTLDPCQSSSIAYHMYSRSQLEILLKGMDLLGGRTLFSTDLLDTLYAEIAKRQGVVQVVPVPSPPPPTHGKEGMVGPPGYSAA